MEGGMGWEGKCKNFTINNYILNFKEGLEEKLSTYILLTVYFSYQFLICNKALHEANNC